MNEEKYIEERMAKQNPFKVPEGYFDSFAEHVMELLPEEKPKAKRLVIRAWMYAAACLLVILFSATVYFSNQNNDTQEAPAVAVSDQYIDEAVDYAMIDNDDIYALLAEN